MALTVAEIDDRIRQLQDGIDSVSEVQFEGEATKYRSISEIRKAIAYFSKLKVTLTKTRSRYRAVHHRVNRGLND